MEKNILYGSPFNKESINQSSNGSLGSMILNGLKDKSSKVAQIDGLTGRFHTYSDILQLSTTLGNNLKIKGCKSGDVISICCENRLEFTIPVFASLYIGVVLAPLNPMYTTDELIHGLNISKPKLIFCSEFTLYSVCEAVKKCHFVSEVILFADSLPDYELDFKITLFSDLLKPLHPSFRVDDFKPDEFNSYQQTAVVLCSSGTTGLPKGVKLSHANLEAFVKSSGGPNSLTITENDVIMGLVPFFHGYGYGMIIIAIIYGPKVVLLPKFEENLFLSTIEKYKITVLPMVPPLMVFLAKHPLVDKYDLSSVKNMFCGAAPCGEDIIKQVMKRLRVNFIRQAYGMTELTIAITVNPVDCNNPKSVGKVVDGAQGKVIDLKTGEAVGPNIAGELCFRGPQVMQGYYNNEKATKEMIDSDGWLHTGDIGYYDEKGFIYIVDRLKELIKYKAYQVAPAELEALLLTHPGVKDVAVIGIPDESCGELPMAFVVKQLGSKVTANEIVEFVSGKVSSQKRLRGGVRFVDEIPKNPSGKILRRLLRDNIKSKL